MIPADGIIVSLADRTGNALLPWAEAGFTCYAVDIQHSIRKDRVVQVGTHDGAIHYVWGDVRSWSPPEGKRVLLGLAFTPCTQLAVSGARDFRKKGWPMLRDGMDLFHAAYHAFQWARCPYALENPVGRIAGIYGQSEHRFHPCDYAGVPDNTHTQTGDVQSGRLHQAHVPLDRRRIRHAGAAARGTRAWVQNAPHDA